MVYSIFIISLFLSLFFLSYPVLVLYARDCSFHMYVRTCTCSVLHTENVAKGGTESFQNVRGAKVHMMYL